MSNGSRGRRETLLARRLKAEIAADGPIGIDRFMARCLSDPDHGYYTTRSGIGRAGDFTTAPEISQIFGELIGLWAAVVWQQMGSPPRVNLVELGPGRGVLMQDALRAVQILPGFVEAIELHLCEINPAFRALQGERLALSGVEVHWHEMWPDLDPAATIVIANEFLDTVPGTQWSRLEDGSWCEICVEIDRAGELVFGQRPSQSPSVTARLPDAASQSIFSFADYSVLTNALSEQAKRAPLAALFVDYGHTATAWGDTLQAVREHKAEHPLRSPGEADLSMAVDFAAFGQAVCDSDLIVDGPVTQAEFLGRIGIAERASRLMAANAARANTIESGVFRLMSSTGMGTQFKVIGVRSAGVALMPGFAQQHA